MERSDESSEAQHCGYSNQEKAGAMVTMTQTATERVLDFIQAHGVAGDTDAGVINSVGVSVVNPNRATIGLDRLGELEFDRRGGVGKYRSGCGSCLNQAGVGRSGTRPKYNRTQNNGQ